MINEKSSYRISILVHRINILLDDLERIKEELATIADNAERIDG